MLSGLRESLVATGDSFAAGQRQTADEPAGHGSARETSRDLTLSPQTLESLRLEDRQAGRGGDDIPEGLLARYLPSLLQVLPEQVVVQVVRILAEVP